MAMSYCLIAAIDGKATVGADADERTGARDLGRIVADRAILEGGERRLDLAEARIHRVGQFLGVLIFGFELGVLSLQRLDRRLFLAREIGKRALEFAQAMG